MHTSCQRRPGASSSSRNRHGADGQRDGAPTRWCQRPWACGSRFSRSCVDVQRRRRSGAAQQPRSGPPGPQQEARAAGGQLRRRGDRVQRRRGERGAGGRQRRDCRRGGRAAGTQCSFSARARRQRRVFCCFRSEGWPARCLGRRAAATHVGRCWCVRCSALLGSSTRPHTTNDIGSHSKATAAGASRAGFTLLIAACASRSRSRCAGKPPLPRGQGLSAPPATAPAAARPVTRAGRPGPAAQQETSFSVSGVSDLSADLSGALPSLPFVQQAFQSTERKGPTDLGSTEKALRAPHARACLPGPQATSNSATPPPPAARAGTRRRPAAIPPAPPPPRPAPDQSPAEDPATRPPAPARQGCRRGPPPPLAATASRRRCRWRQLPGSSAPPARRRRRWTSVWAGRATT